MRTTQSRRPLVEDTLPDAKQLQIYETIVPGISRELFDEWKIQIAHQRDIERRGLNYALYVALSFLLIAFILILVSILTRFSEGTWAGTVLGSIDIVALVSAFIYGRSRR